MLSVLTKTKKLEKINLDNSFKIYNSIYSTELKLYMDNMREQKKTIDSNSRLSFNYKNTICIRKDKVIISNNNSTNEYTNVEYDDKLKRVFIKEITFVDCKFVLQSLNKKEFNEPNVEVRFIDCEFKSCYFENLDYKVFFKNCNFHMLKDVSSNFNIFNKISTLLEFNNCKCNNFILCDDINTIQFAICEINNMNISKKTVINLHFYDCKITNSTLINFSFNSFRCFNTNFYNTHLLPLAFISEDKTNIDSETEKLYLSDLLYCYGKISNDFSEQNKRYFYFVYYLLSRLTADSKKFKDYNLSDSRFIERWFHYFIIPRRIIKQMIGWIIFFGLCYSFIGLRISGSEAVLFSIKNSYVSISDIFNNIYLSIYFSCLTFATVGYGDYIIKSYFEIMPMVEMLLGVAYFGILTGSIFKRYI